MGNVLIRVGSETPVKVSRIEERRHELPGPNYVQPEAMRRSHGRGGRAGLSLARSLLERGDPAPLSMAGGGRWDRGSSGLACVVGRSKVELRERLAPHSNKSGSVGMGAGRHGCAGGTSLSFHRGKPGGEGEEKEAGVFICLASTGARPLGGWWGAAYPQNSLE